MTQRNRYFIYGAIAIIVGIILFFVLFYGLRNFLYEGGDDAEENFVAFAVGMATFLVSAIFGASFITIGLSKPKSDA